MAKKPRQENPLLALARTAIANTDWDGYHARVQRAVAREHDALREARRRSAELNQAIVLR